MSVKSERKRPFKDVIVKEMDIYLTSNLAPKLHVFDFPPGFDPLSNDKTNLLGVKVKLESKRFMVDIKIDTKSRNYDQGKSEQIAYITGGEPFFPNNHMNKLILKSNEAKPSNLQYAVGLIKHDSDEIHLTPVNSVIQFKPSFDYFEHKDKKSKLDGPGTSKTGIDSNEEEKKEEDVKKVLVRFETPDEERKKKARESSFSFIRQKIANEPWTDINVSLRQTPTAMKEKENLVFHQPTDEFFNGYNNPDVIMSDDQVHNSNDNSISSIEDCLKPFINTETATTTCLSSLKKMKNLPLSNKIHTIMMKAKVVSLSDLKDLLPDADPVHLIRNLQQFAVIVQGNWVVKSEVLHFKENGSNTSPLTGIPIELLSRARDFILWSFSQETPVSRPELIEKTKIPPDEILHILKETAKFNFSDKLWYFMLPKDTNFIEKYPEVDQRQKLLWDARFVQVNKAYSAHK